MRIRLLNKNEDAKDALENLFSDYEDEENQRLTITYKSGGFSHYELKITHEEINSAYVTTIQDQNTTYKTPKPQKKLKTAYRVALEAWNEGRNQ